VRLWTARSRTGVEGRVAQFGAKNFCWVLVGRSGSVVKRDFSTSKAVAFDTLRIAMDMESGSPTEKFQLRLRREETLCL
jgi:hypothetical protein